MARKNAPEDFDRVVCYDDDFEDEDYDFDYDGCHDPVTVVYAAFATTIGLFVIAATALGIAIAAFVKTVKKKAAA